MVEWAISRRMNMNLELPPETESLLHQQASKSGMTTKQFALMVLRNHAVVEPASVEDQPPTDHKKWMKELRAWSKDHPGSTHFVDDSRESIYEGRGL